MKKNEYKGKFIAFEGLDGSGQTTQANLLKKYSEKKGLKVVLTKQPTSDSEAGKEIRKILGEKATVSPTQLQELFSKDRSWHQENRIEPNLEKGRIVITDRSQFSSFAFGAASGVDLGYLIALNERFMEPDLTILLKVSPKICIERIKKRGEKQTLFEKEKQLEKVWEVYEKLTERFRSIVIIDGEKSIEEIHEDIKKLLTEKDLI